MAQSSNIHKDYKCSDCGNVKQIMVNHDKLPEVWERCTDACSWGAKDGPRIPGIPGTGSMHDGFSGFRKRRYIRL